MSEPIVHRFQSLYLKHYGKQLDALEAERILVALGGLLQLAAREEP